MRKKILLTCCGAVLLLSRVAPALSRTDVAGALRSAKLIVIPSAPLPVERTVAGMLLKRISPGARVEEREGPDLLPPGSFRVRVLRSGEDTTAGWFTFTVAPDGTGELVASRAHLLYGALCTVLDEWSADDALMYARGRKGFFRLRWLEGNDGLFVGVPRFIRGYDPEATIRELARLGCSHVSVNVLAATEAAEQGVPGEIYSRFYVYSPDIDQFVETDLTRGLYPPEYLQANLDLLKKNAALAVAYGLTPGLTVCSPRTMPESFFTRYPFLRGARVDHPFRSFRPRYTATLSHPLVRWHYAQLMRTIMREVPGLGFLVLWTNDSGSGFEYVSTLYAGRNGGAYLIREWKSDSAVARAAGENVVRYLRLLRDAASETNPRFRVITSLHWFGAEKDAILGGLGDRLDLQVQPADTADHSRWGAILARAGGGTSLFGSLRAAPNYILGVPCPWLVLDRLKSAGSPGVRNFTVTFDPPSLAPWSVNREVIRAWQCGAEAPPDTLVWMTARRWCGAEAAPGVVRAWRMADSAVRSFPDVPLYGNSWAFPWYRHWVRPFVPDIGAIPPEARAYYERHMIATFNNPTLIDFGADALWLLMDRKEADAIVARSDSLVWGPLDAGIRILDSLARIGAGEGRRCEVLSDQHDRLVALRCYYRTLRNVAGWIGGVHGYIQAASPPEKERSLAALRATIDDEMKNTGELYRLWSSTRAEFMPVALEGESWALYGGNFGELLMKKITLMKQHRNDTPAIDPDFKWRVGPQPPVNESEYLRY
ncbi:MAG TPA: hypothetical protein VK569_04655 [Bacteroidota bacterium]|nr:hypothetical protein [Bacteroidota bacterium]